MRGAPRAGVARPVRVRPSGSRAATQRDLVERSRSVSASPRQTKSSSSGRSTPVRIHDHVSGAVRRAREQSDDQLAGSDRDVPFVADHRAEQDIVLAVVGRVTVRTVRRRFRRLPARRSRPRVRSLAQIGAREHPAERAGDVDPALVGGCRVAGGDEVRCGGAETGAPCPAPFARPGRDPMEAADFVCAAQDDEVVGGRRPLPVGIVFGDFVQSVAAALAAWRVLLGASQMNGCFCWPRGFGALS